MKAHIARNQNAGIPLALGWNLSAADRGILEGMAPAFGMNALLSLRLRESHFRFAPENGYIRHSVQYSTERPSFQSIQSFPAHFSAA